VEHAAYKLKHYNCIEAKIYNDLPESLLFQEEFNIVIGITPLILPNDNKIKNDKFLCDQCREKLPKSNQGIKSSEIFGISVYEKVNC